MSTMTEAYFGGAVVIVNYRAVRAWKRASKEMYELQDIADHLDSLFDGGEWSGGARMKLNARAELALARKIGERFGLTAQQLLDHVWLTAHIQDDHQLAKIHFNTGA